MSGPENFNVQEPTLIKHTGDGEATLIPPSELDLYSAVGAHSSLIEAIGDGRIRRIVFDLSSLIFIDTSGVGLLVAAQKRCQATSGGDTTQKKFLVRLQDPETGKENRSIKYILNRYGLDGFLDIEEPADEQIDQRSATGF